MPCSLPEHSITNVHPERGDGLAVHGGIERPVDLRDHRKAATLGRRLGQPHCIGAGVPREPAGQLADRAATDDEDRTPRKVARQPDRA